MKMQNLVGVGAAVLCGIGIAFAAPDYVNSAAQNQKLGMGAQISSTATGGLAIGSGDGAASVNAATACQLGTGSNGVAGTIKYRDKYLLTAGSPIVFVSGSWTNGQPTVSFGVTFASAPKVFVKIAPGYNITTLGYMGTTNVIDVGTVTTTNFVPLVGTGSLFTNAEYVAFGLL